MTQEGIYSKGKKLLEKHAQPVVEKKQSVITPIPSSLVKNQMEIEELDRNLRVKREAQQEIVGALAKSLKKELPGVDEELRRQVASVLVAVETLKTRFAELKSPNWELEREVLQKLSIVLQKYV